mgnify:CR=1 FL=1
MKKLYNKPESKVIVLSASTILSGSAGTPGAGIDNDSDPIDPGKLESRRRGFGDDDDDESDWGCQF